MEGRKCTVHLHAVHVKLCMCFFYFVGCTLHLTLKELWEKRDRFFTLTTLPTVSDVAFVNGWWSLSAKPFTFEFKDPSRFKLFSGLSRMVFTSEEALSTVFTITIFFLGTGLSETPQTLRAMPVASDVRRSGGTTFVVVLVNTFFVPNRSFRELSHKKANHRVGIKFTFADQYNKRDKKLVILGCTALFTF